MSARVEEMLHLAITFDITAHFQASQNAAGTPGQQLIFVKNKQNY